MDERLLEEGPELEGPVLEVGLVLEVVLEIEE